MKNALVIFVILFHVGGSGMIYVDSTVAVPLPNGSVASPFPSLVYVVKVIPDQALQVTLLPHSNPVTYTIATLSGHQSTTIFCSGNTLNALFPLQVLPGTAVTMAECNLITTMTKGYFMVVMGGAVLSFCTMTGLPPGLTGFAVVGSLQLLSSSFLNNKGSIIAASSFGLKVAVTNCLFQDNQSTGGTIFALSFSQTNPSSSSNVAVTNCTFLRNSATLGGSVLLLMVNKLYELPTALSTESRVLNFTNNVFDSNRGYLFLLYSKFLNITFSGNNITNSEEIVVLNLYNGVMTMKSTVATMLNFFIAVLTLNGPLILSNLTVTECNAGPVIALKNANANGIVLIDNLVFRNITYKSAGTTLASSAIIAYSVPIQITNYQIVGLATAVSSLGTFVYCQVNITNAQISDVVSQFALVVYSMFGSLTLSNILIRNCHLIQIGWFSLFGSTVSMTNIDIADVSAAVSQTSGMGAVSFTIFTALSSVVDVTNCTIALPTATSNPLIYLTQTSFQMTSISVFNLHGGLILSFRCNLAFQHIHLDNFYAAFLLSFNSNTTATVTDVLISNSVATEGAISVSSNSNVSFEGVVLSYSNVLALMMCSNSHCMVSNVKIENNHGEYLFDNVIKR